MPKEQLREKLAELHAELGRAQHVDAESQELLRQITDDIHEILAPAPSTDPHHRTVQERISDAARALESTHPTLAGVIRGVGDLLAQSGI